MATRCGDAAGPYARGVSSPSRRAHPSVWKIHGERVVDDTRRAHLSLATVELPDGKVFEQYLLRTPPSATVVVLDDRDRVLLIWRHRFIIDKWVWELPGGYVDPAEDPSDAAVRELFEETGWRTGSVEHIGSFQPWIGMADSENHLYLARGAEYVSEPKDINEAAAVEWLDLDEAVRRMDAGEIAGAGSIIGLLKVQAMRRRERGA
ncbi:MAG: NUDIX hydrolase [Pseudonocardiales bacterium]|nr:MAG: NUDIX hydrolase [Pseudonocardiales bacterium]